MEFAPDVTSLTILEDNKEYNKQVGRCLHLLKMSYVKICVKIPPKNIKWCDSEANKDLIHVIDLVVVTSHSSNRGKIK